MHPLDQIACAQRSLCAKKTKEPRTATRIAVQWRQGNEIDSHFILFPAESPVNSQRQVPTKSWSGQQ
jgi:hypothetical protein